MVTKSCCFTTVNYEVDMNDFILVTTGSNRTNLDLDLGRLDRQMTI